MARNLERMRRLVIDAETACIWSVRHRHTRGAESPDCRTTLSLRREGTQQRPAITFSGEP
ncbi:hypothetical protein [Streptomyces xantholiticus]|uniref:Transposase n=1 Tax=Streptomyces xantholiticus TaxID=68285 RepID=A0ABV1UNP4_9ACTN